MDMALAQTNGTAIAFFLLFVLATLAVTWWAARRTRSTADYLAAGHRIGPWQNGLALAGDFLSAAGVLGVGGLIALAGFDGILFCMGATVGFTMLLLLLAEPLRNLGSYTFNDVLTVRLGSDTVRVTASVMSILLVLMYLTLQMVGAGTLVHLLFGLPYATAVEITGAIMMVYVLFGGMIATTFVQIIKTSLMLVAFVILVALTAQAYGFHLGELFASVGNRPGPSMVAPGRVFADPIDALSLGLTMPIGVASLPHVLIRFYTVPDAGAARRSVLYATGIIAVVQLGLILVGYAAMQLIGTDAIRAADRGGNLALPLLALHLGGGPLLGFVAAVSFGTILAVVSGVVITGAATMSHDIWAGLLRKGAAQRELLLVARVTTVALGIVGVLLGLALQGQNLAVLVGLSTAIAASTVFPVLMLAIFWSRLTTVGAVLSMASGAVCSIALVYLSPLVQVDLLHHATAVVGLRNPGIISCPLAFAVGIVVSLAGSRERTGLRFVALQRRVLLGASSDTIITPKRVSA
jgi:cation/acetate symporter